jgi:putative restriction endonuclease
MPSCLRSRSSYRGGRHGSGFIAWDIDTIDDGFEQVFTFRWQGIRNPFAYALADDQTQETLADRLLDAPDASEDVYKRVADRGIAQQVFRSALLRAYGEACAFCGFSFPDALEAAHVVPWSRCSPKDRMNVRNGLLLCATHHRLFDNGWMSVTDEYLLVHDRADGPYDRFDTLLTSDLHGQRLRLPTRREHRPDPALIRERARLGQHEPVEERDDDEQDGSPSDAG